jgi:hypothetical protein
LRKKETTPVLTLRLFPKLTEDESMKEIKPRWESEMIGGLNVPKDIICETCIFQTPAVTIEGEAHERYTRSNCQIFEEPEYKPHEVLWEHADCEYYEKDL